MFTYWATHLFNQQALCTHQGSARKGKQRRFLPGVASDAATTAPWPGKLLSLQSLSKLDKSHSLCSTKRQEERHFSPPPSFPKPERKTWLTCIVKCSFERYLNYLGWWFWRRVSIKAEMNRKVLVENRWWDQGEACTPPCFLTSSEILSVPISSSFHD